jgi:O-antigen/teichoic acid export membrane protein
VAWMTASVLFMVSPAVASALYAERTNDGAGRSASLPKAALVVLVVIGVPAAVLFGLGGRILALFSPDYAAAGGTLLKILVLAAIPDAITNLAVAHWRSLGDMRRCVRLNLLMATSCLTLTWLLLPAAGIEAAGVAWLAGQSAGALVVAAHAWRAHLARRPFPGRPAARRPRIPRPHRPASHPAAFHSRTAVPFRRQTRGPARQSRPRSRSWRTP